MIALTKTCALDDLHELAPELQIVDKRWVEGEQHPLRRWEYALALRALKVWGQRCPLALDVGGAGSRFSAMLEDAGVGTVQIIDPVTTVPIGEYEGLAADAVFAISVIEHVEDPHVFLRDCLHPLLCGGLLFLTMDYWEEGSEDTAHFHWMRKRIYDPPTWEELIRFLRSRGCALLGTRDRTYHGPLVYDYSFASLAVVKG